MKKDIPVEKMLAIDLGASSGRAVLGWIENDVLNLEEIDRFDNEPVRFATHLFWDILRLCYHIKRILVTCRNKGEILSGIGIDTWGVDYGLLDQQGELLANPYHYRDHRTDGVMDKCFTIVSERELFEKTGIGAAQYNTLYQLLAMKLEGDQTLAQAAVLLPIPDLLNYMLTGVKVAEYTEAATTQLVDCTTGNWCDDIIARLEFPRDVFPDIIQPGQQIAPLRERVCRELDIDPIPVLAVGSHDTASAITAVPAEEEFIYISTGTWMIVGVESEEVFAGTKAFDYRFSNEGGCGSKFNFQRNVMGLWLLQECRRQWSAHGHEMGFDEMIDLSLDEIDGPVIDPDDDSFYAPDDMVRSIQAFCRKTGQTVPVEKGRIVRCVQQSLALKCRWVMERIEEITGKVYPVVHVFGGGIQDSLLCQMVADASGKKVVAGPVEATAIGNLLVQGISLGKLADIESGRQMVKRSFETRTYIPGRLDDWDKLYGLLLGVMEHH